jgi:hypothetical protein
MPKAGTTADFTCDAIAVFVICTTCVKPGCAESIWPSALQPAAAAVVALLHITHLLKGCLQLCECRLCLCQLLLHLLNLSFLGLHRSAQHSSAQLSTVVSYEQQ